MQQSGVTRKYLPANGKMSIETSSKNAARLFRPGGNKMKVLALAIFCFGAATVQAQQPPTPGELGVVADHHLHLRFAMEIEAIIAFNKNTDEEFRATNVSEDTPIVTASDLIAQLDQAGIRYGVVLSSAYLFGMPEYRAGQKERQTKTQKLNDLTAEEIAPFANRLRAFCSVNPLLDFAEEEVTRCTEELRLAGVKLHFANSDVDLRDADHLLRLRQFFTHVASLDLPVILHLRTRNQEFGAIDVNNFIENVVSHASGVEFYIAHLSGWGGYDANTHAALTAWADALESGDVAEPDNINFDIAATVTRHPNDAYAQIAEIVRRLGPSRIFIGSDWPWFNQPRWVAVNFRNNIPLSEEEHRDVLDNVADYFGE